MISDLIQYTFAISRGACHVLSNRGAPGDHLPCHLDCEDMQLMLHAGEPATATVAVRGADAATGLVVPRLKCLYGVCNM